MSDTSTDDQITDDQIRAMNPEMAAMWIVKSGARLSKPQYQTLVIACRNGGYVEAGVGAHKGHVERVSARALYALVRRGYLTSCYSTEGGVAGRLSEHARTCLAETSQMEKTAKPQAAAPQDKNKVIRDGKVAVLYSSGYGWGWSTHNDDPDDSMLFDPEMVAAVEAGDLDAQLAVAKRKWPDAALPVLSIAWVPQGSRFQLDVHDGLEDVQILHLQNWRLA